MRGCIPIPQSKIDAVAGILSTRDRALFILGVRTGYRISELLSLKVKYVWDGTKARDAIQVRSRNMKGNAPTRCVALHAEAKAAIHEYLVTSLRGQNDGDEPLFLSRKGGALDRKSAWRILHQAFLSAGIQGVEGQLGTHVMRKTFASIMRMKVGPDLIKMKQLLGHSSIESTASYLSFDEEELRKAVLSA